jgi:hypothetical protein
LLKEMAERGERRSEGGDQRTGSIEGTSSLADLGVTNKQSHNWQKLAALDESL